MSEKIPLDQMLHALDTNKLNFFSSLTPEQKKNWSAWLTMRYASSAQGNDAYHYLLMTNSLVNVDFNTLRHHPELQWKLLALCGVGNKSYHPWIAPSKKGKKDRICEFIMQTYPEMNSRDAQVLSSIITKEELIELAKASGLDNKEVKELVK